MHISRQDNTAKLNIFNAYLHICMDNINHGVLSGRIFGERLTAPLIFSDLSDMMLQIDAVLDLQDFPRAYQRKRTFIAKPLPQEDEHPDSSAFFNREDCAYAFAINIISRHNASWQGVVDWLDGRPSQGFTSELEFLRLLARELPANAV